jgi:hypothetical protein
MRYIITVFFALVSLSSIAQLMDMMPPIQKNIYSVPAPGYIFITPTSLNATDNHPTSLALLDSAGNYVFFLPDNGTENIAPFTITRGLSNFDYQKDGLMTFGKRVSSQISYMTIDSTFNLVDSSVCEFGALVDPHEFLRTSSGETIHLCHETRTMDMSMYYTTSGAQYDTATSVKGNIIQHFDVSGNLIFEWKTLDHFSIDDSYAYVFRDSTFFDHAHVNSIEIDADSNYLISSRFLHEVTKINKNTGQIIWRFGGKNNDFTFVGDTVPFSAQHDVRLIGNNSLLIFDNANHSSTDIARSVNYILDTVSFTATLNWEYKNPHGLSSRYQGSSRRLPGGNTVINWAAAIPYTTSELFSEVDPAGNVVMELDLPDQYISYRIVKHELPFKLNRPTINCSASGTFLEAPSGYQEYYWNTGDTTANIMIADTGNYQVWVNYGIGYLASYTFHVNNIISPCGNTSINDVENTVLKYYPNPIENELTIEIKSNIDLPKFIPITDISGRSVNFPFINHGDRKIKIDLSKLSTGYYFFTYRGGQYPIIKL